MNTQGYRLVGATTIVVDGSTEVSADTAAELVIRDGRIAAEATGDERVIDVSGCVITAGLVNAHHHLLQSAFRTIPATRGVPMSAWLPAMAAEYARVGVDPELASAAAGVGVAECLLNGVTTVADHHLTWPSGADTVGIATATADAALALGGRLVFVRGAARDDPQEAAASADAIATALEPRTAAGMLQLAVGPAGVHSDPRETFELLADVAAKHGLRRRTQANEQVDVAIALERYGRRPIDLLEEWGWIADDVTLAHLCDVTPDEIARLASVGVTATHAPGCDVPMGWGIARVADLQAAGITVGLGTSGGGSNDAGHLLADARLAMQVSGLVGAQLPARTVLAMTTEGGAIGLGRPELGHLRTGAAADVAVWDVSGVADAGVADHVAGLLWASPGRRPRDVFVAGQQVVADGRLTTADERAIAGNLRALLAARAS